MTNLKFSGENTIPPDRAKGGLSYLQRHLLATVTALLLIVRSVNMNQLPRILMLNNTNSLVVKHCVTEPLRHRPTTLLCQKATPVIVGWFIDHMWKNNRKWYN
jgi:hypothetical protein